MAPPEEVEWSSLSPTAMAVVKHIAMRLTAGYSHDEIADQVEATRSSVRHLELPKGRITRPG